MHERSGEVLVPNHELGELVVARVESDGQQQAQDLRRERDHVEVSLAALFGRGKRIAAMREDERAGVRLVAPAGALDELGGDLVPAALLAELFPEPAAERCP